MARLLRAFRQAQRSHFRCYADIAGNAPYQGKYPNAKWERFVPTSGTYPKGFRASGVHVGVKPSTKPDTPDLALIVSEKPCSAGAVFTKHRLPAASVQINKINLQKDHENIRAVVFNSGCANAVTGVGGLEDNKRMSSAVDSSLGSEPKGDKDATQTLVMSTGVIGTRLPIDKIVNAVPKAYENLSSEHDSWLSAARAICTTDTFPKLMSRQFSLPSSPGITYSLAGMTKGAGMIHPNMATLLGLVATDAPIAPALMKMLLRTANNGSFNCISVDGETSTNDTIALLANGAAGGKRVESLTNDDGIEMTNILTSFMQQLSQLVVRDGEGATKFVRIRVVNCSDVNKARKLAGRIAVSPLVKTALYGKDANWGRILSALGASFSIPIPTFVPEQISVSFVPTDGSPELQMLVKGEPQNFDEGRASEILEQEDLEIRVDLGGESNGKGKAEGSYWTCDYSHEYITINVSWPFVQFVCTCALQSTKLHPRVTIGLETRRDMPPVPMPSVRKMEIHTQYHRGPREVDWPKYFGLDCELTTSKRNHLLLPSNPRNCQIPFNASEFCGSPHQAGLQALHPASLRLLPALIFVI